MRMEIVLGGLQLHYMGILHGNLTVVSECSDCILAVQSI